MKAATATDVKNRFGEFLDEAKSEPVAVNRNGRNVAVLLSWAEYERLSAVEDAWWAARAEAAAAESGYLGPQKSMEALLSLLHEPNESGPSSQTGDDDRRHKKTPKSAP